MLEHRRIRPDTQQEGASHGNSPSVCVGPVSAPATIAFMARASRYAAHPDVSILLVGESGTGKTQLARWIHCHSPRAKGPFHAVSLASIDDALAGSELFGHVGGAYTDARGVRHGAFASANHGTLFLDEIGKASLSVQRRLLTTIEDGNVRPIGADRAVRMDVRLVFATNVPVETLGQDGTMLPDLLPRITAFTLRVPPLRERVEDIPELVRLMVGKHAVRLGYTRIPEIESSLLDRLVSADWPGNLRQLDAAIQRILVDAEGANCLALRHCQDDLIHIARAARNARAVSAEDAHLSARRAPTRADAARQLGVSSATLYRRLKQLRDKGDNRSDTIERHSDS